MLNVIEILGRSTQGMTKPFICRCDDGEVYFVKGRGAGKRSLISEWIAGNLALELGMPIAPFAVVEVPQSLIDLRSRDDLSDLGAGPAFGSLRKRVVELTVSHLVELPTKIQCDVLAFDWWVKNGDRNLTSTGGNPNLFWDVEAGGLMVIDHNLAFDPEFSVEDFLSLHVFRAQQPTVAGDWIVARDYSASFLKCMVRWQDICNTTPSEWWFKDEEQTVPVDFDVASIANQLLGCQDDAFWKEMR